MPNAGPFRSPPGPGDVLDLAVLAALSDGEAAPRTVVQTVRCLCRPWLHPTTDVVCARLAAHVDDGHAVSLSTGAVRLTRTGRRVLGSYVIHGVRSANHGLEELGESLRLSLAHHLTAEERRELHEQLLDARTRCLSAQRNRLAASGARDQVVDGSIRYGIALAEARLRALRGLLAPKLRNYFRPEIST